jgi:hypothetical protein
MGVPTFIEIGNQHNVIKWWFKTSSFNEATRIQNINDYILKKGSEFKPPFDIRILDQSDSYVTLDNDFLEEYNPFGSDTLQTTTAQSTTSSERTVRLRVILSGIRNDSLFLKL